MIKLRKQRVEDENNNENDEQNENELNLKYIQFLVHFH